MYAVCEVQSEWVPTMSFNPKSNPSGCNGVAKSQSLHLAYWTPMPYSLSTEKGSTCDFHEQ